MWCFSSAALLLFGVVAPTQEARTPVREALEVQWPEGIQLRASLGEAFAMVLEAHQDLYRRRLLRPDGRQVELEDAEREREFLFSRISERLFLPADAQRPDRPLDLMLDVYLANQGVLAARQASRLDPDLAPEDLLVFVDPRWNEAPSCLPLEFDVPANPKAGSELPDLGNGSGRFLLFGFLSQPDFWLRREAGSKQRFILRLFDAAVSDARTAEVVSFALEPPMKVRPPLTETERTIAGGFEDLADPVGYTVEHLEYLRDLEQTLAQARRDEGLAPAIHPGWWKDGEGRLVRAPQGHLARWTSDMKVRVLDELFGAGMSSRELREGTLADRMGFWSEAARRWPYPQFCSAVLGDLRELTEWRDGHELEPRIRELCGLRDAVGLDDGQQQELIQLQQQLDRERRRLVSHLTSLLGSAGRVSDVELAFAALSEGVPEALADLHPIAVDQFTQYGWEMFSSRPNPAAPRLLMNLADGAEPVCDAAFEALLSQLEGSEFPEREVLLERLAVSGPISQRIAAVEAGAQSMPTAVAARAWREALIPTQKIGDAPGQGGSEEPGDPASTDPASRPPVAHAAVRPNGIGGAGERDRVLRMLASWPDRRGAAGFLVELIESGALPEDGPGGWGHHPLSGRRALVQLLSEAQRQALREAGRWPAALDGLF